MGLQKAQWVFVYTDPSPFNFGGSRSCSGTRNSFALRCAELLEEGNREREREEAMEMEDLEPRYTGLNSQKEAEIVEEAKVRCVVVENRIQSLPLSKITDSCKRTLLRLVNSELKFLNRLSASQGLFGPISVNIGYLESIVHILLQPSVTGVSRVCKPIPVSSVHGKNEGSHSKGVHVDIVCNFNRRPVWFVVSDRNPKYISWSGSHRNKGLRNRIDQILKEAYSSLTLKPTAIILFFSNGLDEVVSKKLQDEFGASVFVTETTLVNYDLSEELDGDWVNVVVRSYEKACMFQIKVDCTVETMSVLDNGDRDSVLEDAMPKTSENGTQVVVGDEFCSLISKMRSVSLDMVTAKPEDLSGRELLNFDTTALIALVSGISNGGTEKLLATPENEMRKRFKSNFEFVIAQVMSELQNPILKELSYVISGKIGMICESVHLEFKELVSMCGGPNEKLRADRLLECLLTVPDNPSARMMGLLTTRKIAAKNKVVFGTGDYWRAPTLTANMGFVRAISQTGMSLLTLEHRPRALTGD